MGRIESVNLELLLRWHVDIAQRLEALGLTLWEIRIEPMEVPLHIHDTAFFCTLLDGELENDYGSRLLTFPPTVNVFHPAGTLHTSVVGMRGAHLLTVEATDTWIERAEAHGPLPDRPSVLTREESVWHSRRLLREIRYATPCSLLAIEGLALEMLAAASRSPRAAVDQPVWLDRARDLVHAEYTGTVTLREIAERVGAEPARLSAAFRRRYGNSLGGYVRRLRVKLVCEMLRTDAPLAEIALAAGFADQAHCTRVFKQLVGVTPGTYRAAAIAQRGALCPVSGSRAFAPSTKSASASAAKGPGAKARPASSSDRSTAVRQRRSTAAHSSG